VEILNYLRDQAGSRSLVFDLSIHPSLQKHPTPYSHSLLGVESSKVTSPGRLRSGRLRRSPKGASVGWPGSEAAIRAGADPCISAPRARNAASLGASDPPGNSAHFAGHRAHWVALWAEGPRLQ
jgi:hypothetical protein